MKTTNVRCPVCNQRDGWLRYDSNGAYAGVYCEACWAAAEDIRRGESSCDSDEHIV